MAAVASRRGAPAAPRRGSRSPGIALGVGVGLALVFALVFSIAFGSKGVAQHAKALHSADEALRAATVARAQGGMAAHLVLLRAEFGFDAAASLEVAARHARFALNDLAAALADLEGHSGEISASIDSAASTFTATTGEILRLVEAGEFTNLHFISIGADLLGPERLDQTAWLVHFCYDDGKPRVIGLCREG